MNASACRYTFLPSSLSSPPRPSRTRHHHHQLHHLDLPQPSLARRSTERCDVHPSVAQLYLRTLPPKPRRKKSTSSSVEMQAGIATTSTAGRAKSPPGFNPTASFVHSQQQTFPALSATDSSEVSSCSSTSSSRRSKRVTSAQLRALLASSMSSMYQTEVPLYGELLDIIRTVNASCIRRSPHAVSDDEISRLNVERHGAIRVGTPQELALLARIFRVFGMMPVGYYDLWKDAGLPIHATAFRPVGADNLARNPFRIFCSLLRIDLIADPTTRELAQRLLSGRQIVSDRCIELLSKAEDALPPAHSGVDEVTLEGLTRVEAIEFVERVVDIFAWHSDTPVSLCEYQLLSRTHPLVADIVSFRGPHINHLTPRTLDIDEVQSSMIARGIDAKQVVEGPPPRHCPVYLRQTSFHALSERVSFLGAPEGVEHGQHKARFGEIEARGQALTRRGARLYDELMARTARVKKAAESQASTPLSTEDCQRILAQVFRDGFVDDAQAMMRGALGFFMYTVCDAALAKTMAAGTHDSASLAAMVEAGALAAEPVTYEDFLPASAAGIFQSNLPQTTASAADKNEHVVAEMDESAARKRLEHAVGGTILDYFALYAEQQALSLRTVAAQLDVDWTALLAQLDTEGA
ncbi:hypothetical protein PANT_10d00110 [Moesziomyces antarcticus T-34]|uniref:2-oxoadipate dioxygenase/decarboxylase n=1 Tax=Pseudozyma antarctica (strain T-34) TaxID=1151754 RepID=M9M2C6_PSEA3|nr:hypothetical protein PANT_10d00110 [Moesziomyces antarcticus T-34]